MFGLAILIGIYSYLIFGLGMAGWLTQHWLVGITICWGVVVLVWAVKSYRRFSLHKLGWLIVVQAGINLVGALGPELGFDALWYHLTIPRIWLLEQKIFFIDSGYFYYSAMPKLVDLLYVWGDIPAKLTQWSFGLLSTLVTYQLARKFVDRKWASIAAVIFYTNLVVGWQSTTAYVDLGRTFFEVLALYLWIDKKIYKSAVVLGLAIATKPLALGSLPVFVILLFVKNRNIVLVAQYLLLALLVPLPWFLFAYLNTGNPIYPVFSGYDLTGYRQWGDIFTIWIRSADPLNPLYAMTLPLLILFKKKLPPTLAIYCLMAVGIWWAIPRTGGGRFILPYLPAFSVLAAISITKIKSVARQKFLVAMVLVCSGISIIYRAVANYQYLPVIVGLQSPKEFLDQQLDPEFGHLFYYLPEDELRSLYK